MGDLDEDLALARLADGLLGELPVVVGRQADGPVREADGSVRAHAGVAAGAGPTCGRAERAAPGRDRDVREALGALARRTDVLLGHQALEQRRERLDDEEVDDRRDGHERDQGVEEMAVVELRVVDREGQVAEVRLAADGSDDRRHEVRDHGRDERPERCADHDRDGEIHEVAPQQEIPEALHLPPPGLSATCSAGAGRPRRNPCA